MVRTTLIISQVDAFERQLRVIPCASAETVVAVRQVGGADAHSRSETSVWP